MKQVRWTRRHFLGSLSGAAAMNLIPVRYASGNSAGPGGSGGQLSQLVDQDIVRKIALQAVDAARAAGAVYADVRLTRTVRQEVWSEPVLLDPGSISDTEILAIGVRAFAGGSWGFAGSPYWNADDAVSLAREAVAQAVFNARVVPQQRDIGHYPVADGVWAMPNVLDPFTIPVEEKVDFLKAYENLIAQIRERGISIETERYQTGASIGAWGPKFTCQRQERALATTEGGFSMQKVYATAGRFPVRLKLLSWKLRNQGEEFTVMAKRLHMAGKGWELFPDARLDQQLPELIAEAAEFASVERKPVDVGRYTVVCDAACSAALLDTTIGTATELDRAVGDEANAVGTSYLGPDPFAVLGTSVASPLVTVNANRSMPGGLATVRWDAEGVVPDDFTLVRDGVLVDYQTTREQASWLAPWYQKTNRSIRSHGCAGAESASHMTIQQRPNLSLEPGKEDLRFEDLVASTKKGLAFIGNGAVKTNTDFQAKHGSLVPVIREIVDGKLGPIVEDGGALFEAPTLWRNIVALGGPKSTEVFAGFYEKGQPTQHMAHSIAAVPLVVKDVSIFDRLRKA